MTQAEIIAYIGSKIREQRLAVGFSQEKLGAAVGAHGQAVSLWEKGDSFVPAFKLCQIARALKQPISDFYPPEDAA